MDSPKELDLGVAHGEDLGEKINPSSSPETHSDLHDEPKAHQPPSDNASPLHDDATTPGLTPTVSGNESDHTPRSEVPSIAPSPAPWNIVSTSSQPSTSVSEVEYFSSQPIRPHNHILGSTLSGHLQSHTSGATATSTYTPSLRPEFEIVTGQGSHARLSPPLKPVDRPQLHRDSSNASSASTASTTTVRASHARIDFAGVFPPRDYPSYPNQSYSALASQPYPSGLPKGRLRGQHAHGQPSHSSSQVLTLGRLGYHGDPDLVARTAGNTPAGSPGLFTPTIPAVQQQIDERGYYPSPYLHPTQLQAPRETHIADVTVDSISGRKIINDYEVIDELGRGVHGKVKLGRNVVTGHHIAIKIIDRSAKRRRLGKNDNHEEKIRREVAILKKVRHPNVVSLLEVIDDPKAKKVYLILELVELGEVKWRTKGAGEIALVEYRRFQREAEGIFDNEAAEFGDRHIISRAARRRQLFEQRKWDELQRQRSQAPRPPLPDFWSSEHGGGASDDELETLKSHPSTSSMQRQRRLPETDEEKTLEASFMPHRDSNTSLSSFHSGASEQGASLGSTMYGTYETEIPRGRTPSVAGSSTADSLDYDDFEGIPDNYQNVPTMTLAQARSAIRDTVLGLEYLHYQGVIHRDIKPANLLCTSNHRVKISDFGVSYLGRAPRDDNDGYQSESDAPDDDDTNVNDPVDLAKTVGTPAFFAPELCDLDTDPADPPQVTQAIDIWALGVTLYCLVYGRLPFFTENSSKWAIMPIIAKEEPYIPRRRLKAVDERSNSRPSSHGRNFKTIGSHKRSPHELEYDEVDDDLHDLLVRLLEKDSRKRITLQEVKRHPWVVRDIEDKLAWLDETEPDRQLEGKRIELTDHDLTQAVISISAFERLGHVVKKTLAPVSNAIGGLIRSSGSRRRAKSTTTSVSEGGPPSTTSSSSTISQDARRHGVREERRPSLKVDEFSAALKQSRDTEHPLSQSVVASPEQSYQPKYYSGPPSRPQSPQPHERDFGDRSLPFVQKRPSPPDRAQSTMSTATSIKTVRQADFVSQPSSPAVAGAHDTGRNGARGISSFGHSLRRSLREMSSRERFRNSKNASISRDRSFDRFTDVEADNHTIPSVAYSNTVASGHVEQPSALRGPSQATSTYGSPVATPSPNTDRLHPDSTRGTPSRQSSISSITSRPSELPALDRPVTRGSTSGHSQPYDSSDQDVLRAKAEQMRRLLLEESQNRQRSNSLGRQHQATQDTTAACPPSPDDEIFQEHIKAGAFDQASQLSSSAEVSPGSQVVDQRLLVSSSSEDRLGPGISPETSSPSLPSMLSASSSVADNNATAVSIDISKPSDASLVSSNDDGYNGDYCLESDSDDSDDDLLIFGRKPKPKVLLGNASLPSAELARRRKNQSLGQSSHKSTRSGSGGTLKKVRSLSVPEEDAPGRPRGIAPNS